MRINIILCNIHYFILPELVVYEELHRRERRRGGPSYIALLTFLRRRKCTRITCYLLRRYASTAASRVPCHYTTIDKHDESIFLHFQKAIMYCNRISLSSGSMHKRAFLLHEQNIQIIYRKYISLSLDKNLF
jgi:hypothetical protein